VDKILNKIQKRSRLQTAQKGKIPGHTGNATLFIKPAGNVTGCAISAHINWSKF
jgi:hypothetical protein